MQASEQKLSVPSIQGTIKQWKQLGDNYSSTDSCPQTFFYTLSNLMKLESAEKILQIASGAGKLIPMILDLKNPNAEYYATDICQKMLQILKIKLQKHFTKYKSQLSFQEWMNQMKLTIKLVNGQEQLSNQITSQSQDSQIKFDRIIANLVLMLTPDPYKMLKNLANYSTKGCLLGLTVWGKKQNNTYHTIFPQLIKQYEFPEGPKSRSNFHLYKNVGQLAKTAGWQVILNWDQNGILPFLNAQQTRQYAHLATSRMSHLNQQQQKVLQNGFVQRIKQMIDAKNPPQFSGQCYLLKKI